MKVTSTLANITIRVLAESLDVHRMTTTAEILLSNYDIYRRTGFPLNIPIPKQDAARQIIRDIINADMFLEFAVLLIRLHTDGYMGKKYPIKGLKALLKELNDQGLIFDQVNKIFVEDPAKRCTRNWGTMREGGEYTLAFLSIDIVGNTKLVKQYSPGVIKKAYGDIQKIVERAIDKRNGRVWSWEGDGGLATFYFSNRYLLATLCGMEIIHELFIYNMLYNPLSKPLSLRLAIHGGPCIYTGNDEDIQKIDVIKKVREMESMHTRPNALTISNVIKTSLDTQLSQHFQAHGENPNSSEYFSYQLRWES